MGLSKANGIHRWKEETEKLLITKGLVAAAGLGEDPPGLGTDMDIGAGSPETEGG